MKMKITNLFIAATIALSFTGSAFAVEGTQHNKGFCDDIQNGKLLQHVSCNDSNVECGTGGVGTACTISSNGEVTTGIVVSGETMLRDDKNPPVTNHNSTGNSLPNITFDEALSVCRQTRGVDLQACIDEKTGQRISKMRK